MTFLDPPQQSSAPRVNVWQRGASPPERVTAVADDGVMIAMRRYQAPGRRPVVLLHGVFGNLNAWDPPTQDDTPAKYLHQCGFDVWLVSYRNHGRGACRSGTTATGNCTIDDLAVLDVPAVIKHVTAATHQRPFIVGHSMGGIVALMYLMGLHRIDSGRVALCAERAQRRNGAVKGLCLVGTPLPLRWSDDPSTIEGLLRPRADQNLLYRKVFGTKLIIGVCARLNRLPLETGFKAPAALVNSVPVAGRPVWRALRKLVSYVATTRPFDALWEPSNVDTESVATELCHALNDVPAGILQQLCDWIRTGTMREHPATAMGASPCNYLAGLRDVTVPILMIAGERDRTASATVARRNFDELGACDKEFWLVRGFGHNDLRMGKRARHQVMPGLVRWMHHGTRSKTHSEPTPRPSIRELSRTRLCGYA